MLAGDRGQVTWGLSEPQVHRLWYRDTSRSQNNWGHLSLSGMLRGFNESTSKAPPPWPSASSPLQYCITHSLLNLSVCQCFIIQKVFKTYAHYRNLSHIMYVILLWVCFYESINLCFHLIMSHYLHTCICIILFVNFIPWNILQKVILNAKTILYHTLLNHCFIIGHLGCFFLFLLCINITTLNTFMHKYLTGPFIIFLEPL